MYHVSSVSHEQYGTQIFYYFYSLKYDFLFNRKIVGCGGPHAICPQTMYVFDDELFPQNNLLHKHNKIYPIKEV